MKPTILLKPGVCALRVIARVTRELLPRDLGSWLPVGVMVVGIILITGLALHASAPRTDILVLVSSGGQPVSTEAKAAAGPVLSAQNQRNKKTDAQRVNPVNTWLLILTYGSHRPLGLGLPK